MGLTEKKVGDIVFLSPFGKDLVQTFYKEIEGAEARVNGNGRTVWEKKYREASGRIEKLYSYEHEDWGHRLVIGMADGAEKFTIEMPLSSGYAKSFLNQAPNINFGKDVSLRPYEIKDKEKGTIRRFLTAYQNNEKVIAAHSKEEPNGMPELKKTKVKGKDTWDDTEQIEFYRKMIVKLREELTDVPF